MASKKFFVDVDLYNNQLLRAVLQSGDTGTLGTILSVAGQVAYDTQLGRITYSGLTGIETLMQSVEGDFGSYTGSTSSNAKSASIKAIYDYYSSTGATEGASVIGINDDDGYFTSSDVEGALREIGDSLERIGSSLEVVGNVKAENQSRNYPTTGDTTKPELTIIEKGDSFLITTDRTGSTIGEFSGDTDTHVIMGPSELWVGVGSLVVAKQDEPQPDNDEHWFILDARRQFTSETAAGLIALATQSEVNLGEDDTKAVTPLKLKAFVENISGTTLFSENVNSGLTGATVSHGLGDDVVVQVWLELAPNDEEDITYGINLKKKQGEVEYTSSTPMPGDLRFVCIGRTTEYWS